VRTSSSNSPQNIAYNRTNLVETSRADVAIDFLIHEFSKIFPSLERQTIEENLLKLKPTDKSNDKEIRDFWNLCASIGIGYRLKDITKVFTEESINWSCLKVNISRLRFESYIGCLKVYFE